MIGSIVYFLIINPWTRYLTYNIVDWTNTSNSELILATYLEIWFMHAMMILLCSCDRFIVNLLKLSKVRTTRSWRMKRQWETWRASSSMPKPPPSNLGTGRSRKPQPLIRCSPLENPLPISSAQSGPEVIILLFIATYTINCLFI